MTDLVDDVYAALFDRKKRRFLVGVNPSNEEAAQNLLTNIRQAASQRYIIDDDMTKAATELAAYPSFILRNLSRAASTFQTMWIEWSHRTVLKTNQNMLPGAGFEDFDEAAADTTGVLIRTLSSENGTYYKFEIFTRIPFNSGGIQPVGLPVAYLFCPDQDINVVAPNALQSRNKIATMCKINDDIVDQSLLGSMTAIFLEREGKNNFETFGRQMLKDLVSHGSITESRMLINENEAFPGAPLRETLTKTILEYAGAWRTVVTLMILLNMREYTSEPRPSRNPAKHRFVNGKLTPYLQVWRVGVNYPHRVVIRDAAANPNPTSILQPVVMVEGHWRAHHKNDGKCDHDDERISDRFFRCKHCKRARWRVDEFPRGDATIGFVTKQRVVKRGKK